MIKSAQSPVLLERFSRAASVLQWGLLNAFDSVVIRRMNLELILQSEVSQKEKDKCCLLIHICRIEKEGTNEPLCRAEVETQT